MSWRPPDVTPPPSAATPDDDVSWGPPGATPPPSAATPDDVSWAPPDLPPPSDATASPVAAPAGTPIEPPRVFISYRRADTARFVEVLDGRLRDDLTSTNVYRDVHDAILGEQFEQRIESEIDRSDAVMVVVGPRWSGPGEGPDGSARLDSSGDLVRREVALALESENAAAALPILVDGATIPHDLPDELQPLTARTYVETSVDGIADRDSAAYQAVLVGVWNAKKEAVPNGIIVFGGESAKARAVVAEIVGKLQHGRLKDLTEVTRYACNARVLSKRSARRLGRRYPGVIIVVDDESADSPILAARVEEVRRRKLRDVAVVTVGGALLFAAGHVSGTGGLSKISGDLSGALSGVEPTKVVGSVSKLLSWRATLTVAGKVAIGATAVLGAAVGASVVLPDPEEPAVPLAGDWSVATFTLDAEENTLPGAFGPIDGGKMSFRPVDESCRGAGCDLVAVDAPEFLRGATLRPDGEGGYETEFFADEQRTMASFVGGIECSADRTDALPTSDLLFDARIDDVTDELLFFVRIEVASVSTCGAGFLQWSARATRVDAAD